MNPGLLAARPTPFMGTLAVGAFGAWTVPPPPEEAGPRQVLDYAAVVGFVHAVAPYRDSRIGIAAAVDKAVGAYVGLYHPDELEMLYHSFMEVDGE